MTSGVAVFVGAMVGAAVGASDVGADVGAWDGAAVGIEVGARVAHSLSDTCEAGWLRYSASPQTVRLWQALSEERVGDSDSNCSV